jgi:hypothetical protein
MSSNKKNPQEKETINISQDKKYVKPKVTKRQKLTKDDIIKALENYEEVDDINDVPINTHIRYIAFRDGKQQYYPGGLLKVKGEEYVVLSNELPQNPRKPIKWSVQKGYPNKDDKIVKTHFFRRITPDDIKIQKSLKTQRETIKSQNELIDKQQQELLKLKKFIKSLDI